MTFWNLDSQKNTATTIDNAANGVAALRILKLRDIRCFGHGFHLIVGAFIRPDTKKKLDNVEVDEEDDEDFGDVDIEGISL